MSNEVLVTRHGQTTIPAKIRKELNIEEGARLKVEIDDGKIVFTKIPSVFDLAGTSKLSRRKAFQMLNRLRDEERVI